MFYTNKSILNNQKQDCRHLRTADNNQASCASSVSANLHNSCKSTRVHTRFCNYIHLLVHTIHKCPISLAWIVWIVVFVYPFLQTRC